MSENRGSTGSAILARREGVLLEREREVALLEGLITHAAAGRSAVGLIDGPAGIGKSRLLAEASRRAAAGGLQVLLAKASELERDYAFGVVRQLFESFVKGDQVPTFRGAAGPAGAILGLHQEHDHREPSTDPSFASLDGLYWLTVQVSEAQPLVLAVDDVQWCDAPSLRFLAYLRSRLEGLPVALLCSLRSSERGSQSRLLGAILSDSIPIRPRPLSGAATADLLERRLGETPDGAFAAACHRATGGNPLLLNELLKELAAEGVKPDAAHLAHVVDLGRRAIAQVVLLRLSRLPPGATSVAEAVAVLGDGADLATVAALAELDEGRAAQAVAALARAEILRPESPLAFVHPLVAAAVYRDVLPGARQLRHRRAAELLRELRSPAEQIAGHLLHAPAGGERWVVDGLARAGADALRKGAADSAVAYLSRALREPPGPNDRAKLLLELGRAESLTNGPAAVEHLREASELLDDPHARAVAAYLLSRALLLTSSPEEGADVARRAAAVLPAVSQDLRQSLEAVEFLCVLFGAGDRRALRRLERHRALPVGAGVGAKMLAAIAAQSWVYACGPSDACSELSLAALAGGDLIAADNGLLATCAITNLTFADREEAESWWELARADAHRRGSLFAMASLNLWRGHTLYRRGELVEAEQSLRTCSVEMDQWGYGELEAQIYCDAHLASVLYERGDLVDARRVLEHSIDAGGADDGARYWLNSHTELLLAERRFEEASAAADDYARRFDGLVPNPMDAPWRSHKARALDALGRRDEALELIDAELALARMWGAPGTVSRTLRVYGMLERERGLDRLEEAVTVVADSPARLDHAKALAAHGATLRRARQPTAAREPLRAALELASACGADSLAQEARAELYAAGARPRSIALEGIASLTASERRVATLVAEGRTNRDVAETLFVTPKTVEMHLGNVYRKLAVSSRRELPNAMAG